MRLVGMSFVVGLLLGGCDIPQEQQRRDVCQAFCDCVVGPLPSQVESCIVDDCLPDVPAVDDACLQCVYENSQQCPNLFNDCVDLCLSTPMPRLGGI